MIGLGALVPQLQALSIGQKIAGAALSVALWLAPAGIMWIHMHGKLSAQYALGKADCNAAQADALAKANAQALADWDARLGRLDKRAGVDAAKIDSQLKAATDRINIYAKGFTDYATSHPLPAGCVADPERVRRFNQARQD